ncbi:MAG TPA: putative quinol monooxygenase [Acetobacteraceae bacterium]|nr:putative quinol monooxygenase [Acetobacteraceae bacterium]
MSQEVRVVAHVKAKPGQETALREALLQALEPVRAEPGCLAYHLHADVRAAGHFVFVETWANEAALTQHMGAPNLRQLAETITPLLAEPLAVTVLRQIG